MELDAGVGETPIGPNLAEALTSAGLWDEALETIEEALGQDPAPEGRAYLLLLRGGIAVARGEHDTAAGIMWQLPPPPAGDRAAHRPLRSWRC